MRLDLLKDQRGWPLWQSSILVIEKELEKPDSRSIGQADFKGLQNASFPSPLTADSNEIEEEKVVKPVEEVVTPGKHHGWHHIAEIEDRMPLRVLKNLIIKSTSYKYIIVINIQ